MVVDSQQDWTREGGENPQEPPGAHPQTEEGPSNRADLLHRLCLPAQQGRPEFQVLWIVHVHVWKPHRQDCCCCVLPQQWGGVCGKGGDDLLSNNGDIGITFEGIMLRKDTSIPQQALKHQSL